MSKINCNRKCCKDVFNAFLVRFAHFAGLFEFPILHGTHCIPNRIISFSKAVGSNDTNYWIHFYEDDYLFERLWKNPERYLPIIKRFNGVILPDFSLYRDMPFVMQLWNIYRSRAIGFWLQENGIKIIPNIRFGDKRTYNCCCDGIEQNTVIAIGTYGTLKCKEDRKIFCDGLEIIAKRLKPEAIIVYGAAPDDIFGKYINLGIKIYQFDSGTAAYYKEAA